MFYFYWNKFFPDTIFFSPRCTFFASYAFFCAPVRPSDLFAPSHFVLWNFFGYFGTHIMLHLHRARHRQISQFFSFHFLTTPVPIFPHSPPHAFVPFFIFRVRSHSHSFFSLGILVCVFVCIFFSLWLVMCALDFYICPVWFSECVCAGPCVRIYTILELLSRWWKIKRQ